MKTGENTLHAIHYKLRMMDIKIAGPTYIYDDNMLVTHNNSLEFTLKEKCNVMASHAVCKSVAMRESLAGHVWSKDNLADFLTMISLGITGRMSWQMCCMAFIVRTQSQNLQTCFMTNTSIYAWIQV